MNDTNSRAHANRTRTVSALTEEQIHQKRGVDRKAQRAFRQRTKDSISNLERKIAQLEESSSEREAQLRQELQTVGEDNVKLIRRLESIARLASRTVSPPNDGAGSQDDHAIPISTQSHNAKHLLGTPQLRNHQSSFPTEFNNYLQRVPTARFTDRVVIGSTGAVESEQQNDLCRSEITASGPLQITPSPIVPPTLLSRSEIYSNEPRSYAFEQPDPPFVALNTTTHIRDGGAGSSKSCCLSETTSNAPGFSAIDLQNVSSSEYFGREYLPASISELDNTSLVETPSKAGIRPVFTVLPAYVAATCPLDQILLGFLNSRREMISKGIPIDTVVGPAKASVKALVHIEQAARVHSLNRVMSEVLLTYHLVGKAEQLALFYLMHQTMRWQICPTRESYRFMPSWLRPTVTQITVPHAAWITNVPWPGVRDMLIEHSEEYPYQLWNKNFTENVSVNWKFDISDTLSETESEEVLHSIFEKHVRNLKNWTVSPEFQRLFPNLMAAIYPPE